MPYQSVRHKVYRYTICILPLMIYTHIHTCKTMQSIGCNLSNKMAACMGTQHSIGQSDLQRMAISLLTALYLATMSYHIMSRTLSAPIGSAWYFAPNMLVYMISNRIQSTFNGHYVGPVQCHVEHWTSHEIDIDGQTVTQMIPSTRKLLAGYTVAPNISNSAARLVNFKFTLS